MSFQSRIAEDRWTCVASMVRDPSERCTARALDPSNNIAKIIRGISKCDLEAGSSKFLDLITRLVRAVMCGTHQNSALCRTRYEKLEGWISNFHCLSENVRGELQEWINAIVHGAMPTKVQVSSPSSSLTDPESGTTRAPKHKSKPVPAPTRNKSSSMNMSPKQACLPWFTVYMSKRLGRLSVQAALHEEIIKPLLPSALKDGYIYVFWDQISFGCVKIGRTKDLEARLNQWNTDCNHTHAYHPDSKRGELPKVKGGAKVARRIT
jgi:hypothetical protein